MNVKLVSWTERPKDVICWAFANMHNTIEDNLSSFAARHIKKLGITKWEKIQNELLEVLATNPHSSVLEFVNTVWYIGGCSRAFQQQLTRTRDAAYSIQSLRIVSVKDFADRGDYQIGVSLKRSTRKCYDAYMHSTQMIYNRLIQYGTKTEDARGILPLNINSPITMAINLRALQHMLEMRLCYLAQGEYQKVAGLMVKEISEKMGIEFHKLFNRPCEKLHYCPMPVNCGKTKYKLSKRYKTKHIDYWLKG
jgi:flavin-dependent thymidylate synthase